MSSWLRVFRPRPDAQVDVVFLPHAGGTASFYRSWGDGLPETFQARFAQYPGRENRFSEPSLLVMADLADALAEAVLPLFARPVVLFGHSLGASLAYEVAVRCERAGHVPALVVASGSPPPHRRPRKTFHLVSDEALVAELRREAATNPSVLDDPELLEILLPMVRADYELIETYHPDPADVPPINAPLAVFHGTSDPEVDRAQAAGWSELAASGKLLGHQVFEGGHFYLRQRETEVLAALNEMIGALFLDRIG